MGDKGIGEIGEKWREMEMREKGNERCRHWRLRRWVIC